MHEEPKPEEQREQQLRQEYGWLYDRLTEILCEHDPTDSLPLVLPKMNILSRLMRFFLFYQEFNRQSS